METKKKKRLFFILAGIGLYFLSAGTSYAVFNYLKVPSTAPVSPQPTKEGFKIDLSAPKTEECPLNGMMFTKAEKEIWSQRRPLGVMIENHEESRPHSGLSKADVVYEAIAEGGITRFLALFYCGNIVSAKEGDYDLGPVRSARTYFLDLISEYGDYPLYTHVGGAGKCDDPTVDPRAKALCQIVKYGWTNKESWSDLNQFSLGYNICRREPDRLGRPVATEHSMYCGSEALIAEAARRKLTNVNEKNVSWDKNFQPWSFKDDSPSAETVSPQFGFWKGYGAYEVKWEYNRETNSYKRINGGQEQIDFSTKGLLTGRNIVIQFVKETGPVDEHKHLLYELTGSGKILVFQDGKVTEGKWAKKSRADRTVFQDNKGKEIKFNRGPIWIEILPLGSEVNY